MVQIKDITGQKFGRLTVLYKLHNYHDTKNGVYWLCVCECGNVKEVNGRNLRNGNIRSCGCLYDGCHIKHGKSKSKLYHIWNGMKKTML